MKERMDCGMAKWNNEGNGIVWKRKRESAVELPFVATT